MSTLRSSTATKLETTELASGVFPLSEKATPFLKWVGGKHRLLPQLRALMPQQVRQMRHVEPFVGGGAVFFDRAPASALLSDANPNLINAYLAVRDHVDALTRALGGLQQTHTQDPGHYYQVRTEYNATRVQNPQRCDLQRAAQFIYLNKTCFNGLHRVNSRGEFNVPQGRYKNPTIAAHDTLYRAHHALQNVEIRCDGFEHLLDSARPGDFIYLDPPYEPVSETSNFTAYADGGFGRNSQKTVAAVCRELDRRGTKWMLSNSDVPFIRELYRDFNIHQITASRSINSDASKRGSVFEVVVTNYKTS